MPVRRPPTAHENGRSTLMTASASLIHRVGPRETRRLPAHAAVTPFFDVDLSDVSARLAAFREHLPDVRVHYAMKANPEDQVIATLAGAGCGFEAASIYEIEMLARHGVDLSSVIFGTAVKPAAHIAASHALGIRVFAADSSDELIKIAAVAPGAVVYIRTAVDDRNAAFAFSEKFGAPVTSVLELLEYARALRLDAAGLSFHVGSQASRPDAWATAIRDVAPIYRRLAEGPHRLRSLNIGGGFPCHYRGATVPSLDHIGASIVDARAALPAGVSIIAEPGRYLVGSAAQLTTTVIGRSERGRTPWLFLDAGCYNGLFEAMAYQGRTQYPVECGGPSDSPLARFSLAGPTGDSADVIARDIELPASTGPGDRIIFRNVGAYTMSVSVPFNGFPRPEIRYR